MIYSTGSGPWGSPPVWYEGRDEGGDEGRDEGRNEGRETEVNAGRDKVRDKGGTR